MDPVGLGWTDEMDWWISGLMDVASQGFGRRGSRPYLRRGGFTRQAVNIACSEGLTKVRPVRLPVRTRQKAVSEPSGHRIEQERTETGKRVKLMAGVWIPDTTKTIGPCMQNGERAAI